MSSVTAGPSAVARIDNTVFAAIGLSWAAGVIHLEAAVWHLDEYVPFAVAFVALAALQFVWGMAAYERRSSRLDLACVLLSLGAVTVWIVSRTIGLPIGPGQPEAWGAADVLASADEVTLCALLVGARVRPGRGARTALVALAVALISLSSLTFMLGGHGS